MCCSSEGYLYTRKRRKFFNFQNKKIEAFVKFSYKVGRFLCLLIILCINNRFVSQNPFPN